MKNIFEEKIGNQIKEIKEEVVEVSEKVTDNTKRVLVVDDNKLNLKVATNFLKPYNIEVETVLSGKEAIEKVKEKRYNIIFMDDMMPEMNGVDTFKQLQKIDNFNTPVIALTANAIDGMREKYLEDGFNDYLSKPIQKDELDRVVNTYLTVKSIDKKEFLKENGVDIASSLELLGNMESYNEMLEEFFNNLGERLINIKTFKESENLNEYSVEVHALKSDCKYLGFKKLSEIAYNHEMKAKEGDAEYIKDNYKELMQEASVIAKIVKDYLEM